MSLDLIISVVVVFIIIFSFIAKLLYTSKPKETYFKCSRCGHVAQHTNRTIEAWRNNKKNFFCQSCHVKWLQSRAQHNNFSGNGCLGIIVFFALIPVIGFYLT